MDVQLLTRDLSHRRLLELTEDLVSEITGSDTTHLNVSSNLLVSLPPAVSDFQSLVHLDVSCNRLQAFPPQICQLSGLQVIIAKKNSMKSLPQGFSELRGLLELDLSGNSFEQFPQQVCGLSELVCLRFGRNFIKHLPSSIASLVKYVCLYIVMCLCECKMWFTGGGVVYCTLLSTVWQWVQTPVYSFCLVFLQN